MTLAQLERESRVAAVEAEQERVRKLEAELTRLHWQDFPAAERVVVDVRQPDRKLAAKVRRATRAMALTGVSLMDREGRREGRTVADSQAERILAACQTANVVRAQHDQFRIDEDWTDLSRHEPYAVIEAVDEAFADNASDSTCIDAGEREATGRNYVTVMVLFGDPELIPDRKPALTRGGKPTMKKRTKTERNAVYLEAMASTVLATVKEALAVSPATDDVNVVVLQQLDTGGPRPVYLGTFSRRELAGVNWVQLDAVEQLKSAVGVELLLKGVAKTVTPLRDVEGVESIAAAFVAGKDSA